MKFEKNHFLYYKIKISREEEGISEEGKQIYRRGRFDSQLIKVQGRVEDVRFPVSEVPEDRGLLETSRSRPSLEILNNFCTVTRISPTSASRFL